MLKYWIASLVVCGVVLILKFVEGSPLRSWKAAIPTAILVSVIACYYVSCAFPKPPPPLTRSQRVQANISELELDLARIDGVDSARIEGRIVHINFSQPKPMPEIKRIVRGSGWAAAYFMRDGKQTKVTLRVSIQGKERYEAVFDAASGRTEEREL